MSNTDELIKEALMKSGAVIASEAKQSTESNKTTNDGLPRRCNPRNEVLVQRLLETRNWSEEQARLGVAFDFKCAYCAKDMLSCVDNHSEWQSDHIIPASDGGPDTEENRALSCRNCNFIKGRWNPVKHASVAASNKGELIEAARKYILDKRRKMEADLEVYKRIVAENGLR